jgi:hypothetical protein
VTEIKINREAWRNSDVQAVGYEFTLMIWLVMGFRAAIFAFGLSLADSQDAFKLAILNVATDLFLLEKMYRFCFPDKSVAKTKTVSFHGPQGFIFQLCLVLSGLLLLL